MAWLEDIIVVCTDMDEESDLSQPSCFISEAIQVASSAENTANARCLHARIFVSIG